MESRVRHLYVHIPFCPAKCSYCAFVTHIGSLRLVPPYVEALLLDARAEAQSARIGPLDTVYFGGGTPSLLEPVQIEMLLTEFGQLFGLSESCEITLEAHPATVDATRLAGFAAARVTRISCGVESLHAPELLAIGRQYEPAVIPWLVNTCRGTGIEHVGLDLIYGLPGQTIASWRETLLAAIGADADHLSLYPLSIEPKTVFARQRRQGLLSIPDDDAVVEMYALACDLLDREGFDHYEVANWAKPAARCGHNLAYWLNREYCAIGVGAHGYIKPWRTERLHSTMRYIDTLTISGDPVFHRDLIDAEIELRETIMLGLRLLDVGIDLAAIETQFGVSLQSSRAPALATLAGRGLVDVQGSRVRLTERGVPLANEVFAGLM